MILPDSNDGPSIGPAVCSLKYGLGNLLTVEQFSIATFHSLTLHSLLANADATQTAPVATELHRAESFPCRRRTRKTNEPPAFQLFWS